MIPRSFVKAVVYEFIICHYPAFVTPRMYRQIFTLTLKSHLKDH